MHNIARGTDPNGFPMLLVAVNLLMLCLFVLLNSLATPPTLADNERRRKVLAEVQEGYDVVAPEIAEDGTTPVAPTTPWAVDMASKLQGVVVNRLRMSAVQMEADATRVVMVIPLENIIAEDKLVGAELVRSLMLAAQGSQLVWQLQAAPEKLVLWAPEIAAVTGQITLQQGDPAALRLVVRPSAITPPTAGSGLQAIGEAQGATLQGESVP